MPLGFVVVVVAVCSLLDHPRLFMLSLKDEEAMVASGIDAALEVYPDRLRLALGEALIPRSGKVLPVPGGLRL